MSLVGSALMNIFLSRANSYQQGSRVPARGAFGFREESASDTPLFSGEILDAYFEEAAKRVSEARTLQILQEAGITGYSSLDEFRGRLGMQVDFPEEAARKLGAALVREGIDFKSAALNILIRRTSTRVYYRGLFSVLGRLASGGLMEEWLDPVSIAYLLMGEYEHIICNCVITDTVLENKAGASRRVRVIYPHLVEGTVSWFWLLHSTQIVRFYPSIFGEPPAKVTRRLGEDLVITDPLFPEEPLRLPVRPSLEEIAHRAGARLDQKGPLLLLNGEPIAVPDYHPERVRSEGIYRALKDVRRENGRLVIEEPRSLFRDYHRLLLAKGHRYHLSRALPTFEYVCDYRIHRGRHLLLTLFAKSCSLAWRLFTDGEEGDLWGELLFMLEQSANGFPPGIWEPGFRESGYDSPGRGNMLSVSERLLVFSERHGLTEREREVLTRLVEGKSNREIAGELFISERTVKTHVASILRKSGQNSRSRLIAEIMWW